MSITITIDGRKIECLEGETLLHIARKNSVFIPAICYLNNCSPTLACRLCLVEADGKQVFACNAKAKDGMNIVTNSEEIKLERKAIMQAYDINHPLECGVCDKSGSCELQNYTLEERVDAQEYAICDTAKSVKKWGAIKYDPSLCIVCERCVTACSDLIGDKAIGTVARGGAELDKSYKETMPKNAFTIWQRFNKNLIGIKSGAEQLDCTLCGECVAVCPVGAMTSAHFTYSSNAWELSKVPSSCAHCASACHLYYEVKHKSIADADPKIYRVTNEWNYQSLCGAGRYAFDYANKGTKDAVLFSKAKDALDKASAIKFNGYITNEEALMLQTLKKTKGVKLYSPINKAYQEFLKAYSSVSKTMLYSADTDDIKNSNFIVSVGSFLKNDAPNIRFAVNNALSNKGAFIYAHPVNDGVIGGMSKSVLQLNHLVGKEEQILWLMLQMFANRDLLDEASAKIVTGFDKTYTKTVTEKVKRKVQESVTEKVTDENGIESEVVKVVEKEIEESISKDVEAKTSTLLEVLGLSEDSYDKIMALYAKKDKFAVILGADLYLLPNAKNIAKLAAMLEKATGFKAMIIPPQTNSLGVALVCELDDEASGYSVGYNEPADFVFSSIKGFGDIALAALNQQEGTFTNVDKRLVTLNAAIKFDGYELNDFLGSEKKENTIDWTQKLPTCIGFKNVQFDNLTDGFANDGTNLRGYALENLSINDNHEAVQYCLNDTPSGDIVYLTDDVNSFNAWTDMSSIVKNCKNSFMCSAEFATTKGLSQGDKVVVDIVGEKVTLDVVIDKKISGNICLAYQNKKKYPYVAATISKG